MEEHIMSNDVNVLKKTSLFPPKEISPRQGFTCWDRLERPWADRGNKNSRTGDVLEG